MDEGTDKKKVLVFFGVAIIVLSLLTLAYFVPQLGQPLVTMNEKFEEANTGTEICDCGLLPVFGIIIPVAFLVGTVGLFISYFSWRKKNKEEPK